MWRLQVFISLLAFGGAKVFGQNIQQTFELAEHQFKNQNYKAAEVLYQRVLFFDSSNSYFSCHKQLSEAYLGQKKFEKSFSSLINYRNSLEYSSKEWIDITLQIASIELQDNRAKEALSELIQLKYLETDSIRKKRINLHLAVSYFQVEDFENSKTYFKTIIPKVAHDQVDLIFKKNKGLEKRYNPIKLQILSALIPGAGQIYAGYYKEGANSLILVSSFMALLIRTSRIYGLAHGFISVYPWVSRYHTGGIKKVYLLGEEKIKTKRNIYYHELLGKI